MVQCISCGEKDYIETVSEKQYCKSCGNNDATGAMVANFTS